jgi:PAS domain-containing protein
MIETHARRGRGAPSPLRWDLSLVHVRAEPLRDPAGTIVTWYGINADIEDRKRAEIGLQRGEADAPKRRSSA